jgi:type IV pilus assembly protein PilY1
MNTLRSSLNLGAGMVLGVALMSVASFQVHIESQGARLAFADAWADVIPIPEQDPGTISQTPLFLSTVNVPSTVMLNMSNDNQLYFNAYPEYADLTGDGAADRTYQHGFDYYGYFDSYKCYTYNSGVFEPASTTADKYCSGSSQWSGNFLNWLTMARIDVVRKILYGGYRSTDTASQTILERTYLPNDAHSWVRYYDGDDIAQLTPFSLPAATQATSTTTIAIPDGSRSPGSSDNNDKITLETSWHSSGDVQVGDQVIIDVPAETGKIMMGVVTSFSSSSGLLDVQVTGSVGVGQTSSNWRITNQTRRGVSFCNTTVASGSSQNVTASPLLRVVQGNYSLWTANERWQCRWSNEQNRTGHNDMRIAGISFSNGNDFVSSGGIMANADNPVRNEVGLGEGDYTVRVEACIADLIGEENCKTYPDGIKPVGLLQQFGEEGQIRFGLMTGSYSKNLSGGVLRKNVVSFADEVNPDNGVFTQPSDSIVANLDALRIHGYNHGTGVYSGAGDDCGVGVQKSQMADGRCMNWGNPQAEMFLESLRYLAGKTVTSAFNVTETDKLSGLTSASWEDPLNNDNWCSPLSIINFNASVSSFDGNQLSGASDIDLSNVSTWTDKVGSGEGIHGNQYFIGGSNALCTAESVSSLAGVLGLCPEAPNQDGTFQIAGLAHYAHTESIRTDLRNQQDEEVPIHVKTYGVTLAPAVPRIDIPRPGETDSIVTILPACENTGDGGLRCALADFRVLEQDTEAGTGSFFIQWDVHEWGSDFDMDINGTLSYEITNNDITITTNTWAQSSSRSTGFGYIISGTTQDGYHAHSGINNYNFTDPSGVLGCSNCRINDVPTSVTYTLGGGPADLLREPMYYAAKWGGFNKRVNEILQARDEPVFPGNSQTWDRSGDGNPDNYYFAIDPSKLADDLAEVFSLVLTETGSAAAVATNSTRLDGDTKVYQARFDSTDWSGDLVALPVLSGGRVGTLDDQGAWQASETLSEVHHSARNIFTWKDTDETDEGIEFRWNNLDAAQQLALLWPSENLDDDGDVGESRLDYIRGDRSGELNGDFRVRESLMGDIVNSNPVFHHRQFFRFNRLSDSDGQLWPEAGDYVEFWNQKHARSPVIFVGSNNGMLHAFNADTGDELFAYVPRAVFPQLKELTEENYVENHRFFVDGQIDVVDAYVNGAWRTVLLGALGAGGRSIFALDVTDPENFTAADVLWEFTHPDLGFTIGQPRVVPLVGDRWAAAFGNGYGANKAALFIVDLDDGTLLSGTDPIVLDSSSGNGLASTFPLDSSGSDQTIDYIYAGDLQGQLWRVDLTDTSSVQLLNNNNHAVLFTAQDGAGNRQPITVRPNLLPHPEGGFLLLFGTGKFFEDADNLDNSVQSYYGVWDQDPSSTQSSVVGIDRDDLQQQEIIAEIDDIENEVRLRVTSQESVNYSAQLGWYIDLVSPNQAPQGERVIDRGLLLTGDRIMFNTLVPTDINDPCAPGTNTWLVVLDALGGGRSSSPAFDLDGDSEFGESDKVEITVVVDGETITEFVSPSAIALDRVARVPSSLIRDEEGTYVPIDIQEGEEMTQVQEDRAVTGRQSWRQLR